MLSHEHEPKLEHFISASTGSLLQLTDNAQHPYFSYAGKRPLDQRKQVQL